MSKYAFKIYLNDGTSKEVIPQGMKNTDLSDMDKFAFNCGSYFGLLKALSNEFDIPIQNITKVSIFRLKKNVEFSVAVSNPYLNSVVSALTTKKVLDLRNNEIETIVIPTSHPSYIEMKQYLFQNIQSEDFFQKIYTYRNEFQRLLTQYAQATKLERYGEEEESYFAMLKRRVETELSIYKNYRGFCIARKKYEDAIRKSQDTISNNTVSIITVKSSFPREDINLKPLNQKEVEQVNKQIHANRMNQYVNDLGEEREEFLDSDELIDEKHYRY